MNNPISSASTISQQARLSFEWAPILNTRRSFYSFIRIYQRSYRYAIDFLSVSAYYYKHTMGTKSEKISCPNCNSPNPGDSSYCSTCGSYLEETIRTKSYPQQKQSEIGDFTFQPGAFFGERYQIIELIGRGGMGKVYKAKDLELGIFVALKIIRPDHADKPWFIQRIKQETLLGRSVAHENVVRIFDIGETEKLKYISMEYVKGQSLKELIRSSGSLTVETAVSFSIQICRALSAAHKKTIIHRDLKPSNIMVDVRGTIQIMDFGLAILKDEYTASRKSGIVGTPAYLSPEQAEGRALDHRTDIYNVGCLIYEMLTGAQPYCADSTEEFIDMHLHEAPPAISRIKSNIPQIFEDIVLRCLAKNPDDRYQSCDEIILDLETVMESTAHPSRKKFFQKIARPILIVILPAALAVAVYYFFIVRGRGETKPPVITRMTMSVLPLQNNSGDESLDSYRWVFQEMMITDLEHSRYLHVIPTIRLNAQMRKMNQDPQVPPTKEALDRIAEDEKIQYYLQGHFIKFRENLRFTVKIVKPFSYETVNSQEIECKGEDEILDRIDELTIWIKSNLGFSRYEIINDNDENIKNLTKSKQALQLYYRARRLYFEGEYQKSIQSLEEACQLDPDFAMAYRDISTNYAYLQDLEKSNKYAKRALELVENGYGSERDRMLIQAHAHNIIDRSFGKAIELYDKVLENYPEDPDVHARLASIYRNLGEWDLAETHFMQALFWNPDITHSNLTWIYAQKGQYNKALDLLNTNQDILNPIVYNRCMANTFLCLGEPDAALPHAKMLEKVFPDNYEIIVLLGNIFHLRGDFPAARRNYRTLLDDRSGTGISVTGYFELMLEEGRFSACAKELASYIEEFRKQNEIEKQTELLMFLSLVQYEQGDYGECRNTCAKFVELRDTSTTRLKAWHISGLAEARADEIAGAEDKVEKMRQLIESRNLQQNAKRDYLHLAGIISLEKGDYEAAVDIFQEVCSSLGFQNSTYDNHAFYIDSLAHAFYLHKDIEQAEKRYVEILNLTTGRLRWGAVYVRSHYWLGKIAQENGRLAEAEQNFKTFLSLWENADSNLPEIADAKNQLAVIAKTNLP